MKIPVYPMLVSVFLLTPSLSPGVGPVSPRSYSGIEIAQPSSRSTTQNLRDGAAKRTPPPSSSIMRREIPSRQKALLKKQEIRTAIHEKRLIIGMTQAEVRSAWGWPDLTHPVQGVATETDRWTYRREGKGFVDLYFENGILTHR
ncbi:MAG: hypothetical protein NTZ78_07915 [Candidatus Aureabacteria bacterium]|nr:hypothetical protein [Candidatus Auribacterota bacterium]